MNSCRFFIVVLAVAVFLAAIPAAVNAQAQQKVDVEKEMIKRINANNQVKAKLVKHFTGRNVNGSAFKVTSFVFAGNMKQIGTIKINADQLDEEWEFLGSSELINCTSMPLTTAQESFSTTTRNTVTVTKTMNMSYTQHGEAKVTIEIIEMGGGWSATMGYSQSWEDSSFEQVSVTHTLTSDTIPPGKGLIKVLEWKKTAADQIPYNATFEPTDNTSIIITMQGTNGSANIYQHFNYGGNHAGLDWKQEVPDLNNCRFADVKALNKEISSVKVFGGAQVFMFARPNYAGDSRIYTAHTSQMTDFNDKCRSLKVVPITIIQSVKFKDIKNLLPLQVRQFKSTGYVKVNKNFGDMVRVMPYEYTQEEFNKACNVSSPAGAQATAGTQATAGAGGSLKSRRLTKAQWRALVQAGKIKKHQ